MLDRFIPTMEGFIHCIPISEVKTQNEMLYGT
jgi:hypothetical protein